MQPIERYALVTLLFLIVLIVVGALWDDGKVDASGGPAQEIARSQATESRPSPRTRSRRRTPRRRPRSGLLCRLRVPDSRSDSPPRAGAVTLFILNLNTHGSTVGSDCWQVRGYT